MATGPFIHAQTVFLETRIVPLLSRSNKAKQQKFCPNEPGGRARLFFFLFSLLFISFILLIQFNYSITLLTSLKDARTRRLPESTPKSSRARSHGLTGPPSVRLCDQYVLARPRTTSTDAARNPSMLAPSQQKVQNHQNKSRNEDQKIKQIQKNERKAFWTLAVTSQCRT
jgi:hypothetical protein